MQFQLSTTDGAGQTGILTVNTQKMKTPTIMFHPSSRYHPPSFAEGFISLEEHNSDTDKKSIINVGNSIFSKQNHSSNNNSIQNYYIIPEALPFSVQKYLDQFDKQHHKNMVILPGDEKLANEKISSKSTQLYIISNTSRLYSNPKKFISYITQIRRQCNYDSLLYTPLIASPSNLAILTYIGIDLFDATNTILCSRHHQFFLPNLTSVHINQISENPCMCPICSQTQKLPKSFSFTQLLTHNYYILWQELLTVRHAIQHQKLRDLVEQRIRFSPHLVTLLRQLDKLGEQYIEERTPVCMPEGFKLKSTSREAGFRPEIKRFQHRIQTRYQKPQEKKILLLLPCSARKPYSFSKSHQRFQQVISKIPHHSVIHELIVTSPLGLVPRELELTYPASSYDISVTGTWYEDEKQMIQQQLTHFLKQNKYDAIVSHLPNTLAQPPENMKTIWHNSLATDKATSKESLHQLNETLYQLTEGKEYNIISKADQRLIQMKAIATYQFGLKLANALTKEGVVKGKYPYLKLFDKQGTQLGMIPDQRGLISLTGDGGKRMIHLQKYLVTIDTGFTVKGSILSPGVNDADPLIRKGDDVLVKQGENFIGVGSAEMNGVEMVQRTYGEAVNMRHKIKN
jgi:archaeosine synthase